MEERGTRQTVRVAGGEIRSAIAPGRPADRSPWRVISDVECLSAEFEGLPIRDRKQPEQGEVKVSLPRIAEYVAFRVPIT